MAPRPAVRRERNNDFSAVGKVGRRTGITVPQGRLDENGLEEMSNLFSSPCKPSPLRRQIQVIVPKVINEDSTLEVSEAMTGMDSTGLTPTQVLSTRKSLRGTSIPPPRSSSPRKSGINGSARRSNGVDVLSIGKEMPALDPEDRENTPVLTPTRPAATNVRRFSPSPEKSPLREVMANGVAPSRLAKGKQRIPEPTLQDDQAHPVARASAYVENWDIAPEDGPQPAAREREDYEFEPYYGGDDDVSFHGGSQLATQAESPKEGADEEMHESIEIDEQVDIAPLPQAASSRRARKRKSDSLAEDERQPSHEPPLSTHPAKKAKTTAKRSTKDKGSEGVQDDSSTDPTQTVENQPKRRGRPPKANKAKNPPLSTQQEAELGEIIDRVRARPGPQKSLYILRRETPADDSAIHTRSGRVSVKPLAYWRNERCVYGGSPGGVNLSEGARFPLNSIKEIIRTEEVEKARSRSPSKSKRKGRKGKGKSRAGTVEPGVDSDSDSGADGEWVDPDADEWEASTGIYRGDVSVWDQRQQAPLDILEEVELAYAPASIETKEVKSMHGDQPTFKFAKLLSANFFGSGIVELAPGDVKRPKNSRKMHMSFFVASGRVTVEVGSLGGHMNRFSVGKGGFWHVPRGNQYSIENELGKTAKVFFSQACEPLPVFDEGYAE